MHDPLHPTYTDTPQSEDAQVRAAVRAGVVAGPKGEEVGT